MKILTISGSLRTASTNTVLLRALTLVAAEGIEVTLFEGVAAIPPFNPDHDVDPAHEAVAAFRRALRDASVVVISTPEYAHGVPGSLKNALDWVVGSGELSEKPVALLHASERGQFAQASLREILKTMNAAVLSEIETTIQLPGKNLDAQQVLANDDCSQKLRLFLSRISDLVAG